VRQWRRGTITLILDFHAAQLNPTEMPIWRMVPLGVFRSTRGTDRKVVLHRLCCIRQEIEKESILMPEG
jgi:hypothetical protein